MIKLTANTLFHLTVTLSLYWYELKEKKAVQSLRSDGGSEIQLEYFVLIYHA